MMVSAAMVATRLPSSLICRATIFFAAAAMSLAGSASAQYLREARPRGFLISDSTHNPSMHAPPVPTATQAYDRWAFQPLVPVDAGVADINPLSRSFRVIEPGLKSPTGFSEVYEVPNSELHMRIHGALHAVFPSSRYLPVEVGSFPVVPDDTTFYIGLPSFQTAASQLDSLAAMAAAGDSYLADDAADLVRAAPIDNRVPAALSLAQPTGQVRLDLLARRPHTYAPPRHFTTGRETTGALSNDDDDAITAAIIVDDEYRARRVRELMLQAARARDRRN
jgi:hypothetical protein